MRLFYLGLGFIIAGVFLFALAAYLGEGGFALFIVFPVFYSTGVIGLVAILLIFLGFLLIFFAPFESLHRIERGEIIVEEPHFEEYEQQARGEKKFGGVVLIGPIPIVFGSDKNMALVSTLVAILILIALIFLFLTL